MSEAEAEEAQDAPEGDDQSMEEILQSIRRIITEDEEEEAVKEPEAVEEVEKSEKEPAPAEEGPDATADDIDAILAADDSSDEPSDEIEFSEPEAADEAEDSDILELTEVFEEEPETTTEEVVEAVQEEAAVEDVLGNIDAALDEPAVEEPEPVEEAPVAEEAMAELDEEPEVPMAEPVAEITEVDDSTLISEDTAVATTALFHEVKQASAATHDHGPATRSGTTLEDLMIEAMRPMLKEWLDEHLPSTVERIVEKEVKKLAE